MKPFVDYPQHRRKLQKTKGWFKSHRTFELVFFVCIYLFGSVCREESRLKDARTVLSILAWVLLYFTRADVTCVLITCWNVWALSCAGCHRWETWCKTLPVLVWRCICPPSHSGASKVHNRSIHCDKLKQIKLCSALIFIILCSRDEKQFSLLIQD